MVLGVVLGVVEIHSGWQEPTIEVLLEFLGIPEDVVVLVLANRRSMVLSEVYFMGVYSVLAGYPEVDQREDYQSMCSY